MVFSKVTHRGLVHLTAYSPPSFFEFPTVKHTKNSATHNYGGYLQTNVRMSLTNRSPTARKIESRYKKYIKHKLKNKIETEADPHTYRNNENPTKRHEIKIFPRSTMNIIDQSITSQNIHVKMFFHVFRYRPKQLWKRKKQKTDRRCIF